MGVLRPDKHVVFKLNAHTIWFINIWRRPKNVQTMAVDGISY